MLITWAFCNRGTNPASRDYPRTVLVCCPNLTIRDRLQVLIHGEEWVARKVEEALALAPHSGPIREYLQKMANRHRFEVEWGRAELIRLMNNAG